MTWGVLAAATMFVRSPASFYLMRFLLGVAEAGFFPGIVYYLTFWFPEWQRARALSRFAIAVPLANGLGGPLGGALLGMDGRFGLAGWQWLFLVEGLPAVVLGVIALRYLSDRPELATWLPLADRDWLRERLERERRDSGKQSHPTFREAVTSPAVWRLSAPYFLMGVTSYALSLWLPLLLRDAAGISDQQIGWVLLAIGAASAAGMLLLGWHSDRGGERVGHAAFTLVIAAVGCVLAATFREPLVVIAGLTLAIGAVIAFLPVFWCLPPRELSAGAAAGGIALINSLGNLGGFVGPNVLGLVREHTGGFTAGLLTLGGITLAAAVLMLWLHRGPAVEPRVHAVG
jgi:ACS family tartrate transporter-like MFS transporter